jgi:hypothetical protein
MIRSLLFLLLFLPLALNAQNQPPLITTRILTYAPAGLPDSFKTFYRTGNEIELFTASAGTLGLPINYTGPQTFALYASKTDMLPPAEGQKPKSPVATVTLPANSDVVLILCTRTADGKVGLVAFNITSNELKPGDYRVFNFSKSTTSIILGEQRFALAPGKDSMVRDSSWHSEVIALPIKIATVVEGKPKLAFSSLREHFPQRRNLMFLFDGRHPSRPITFVTFNADLPPLPKNEAVGSTETPPPSTGGP